MSSPLRIRCPQCHCTFDANYSTVLRNTPKDFQVTCKRCGVYFMPHQPPQEEEYETNLCEHCYGDVFYGYGKLNK